MKRGFSHNKKKKNIFTIFSSKLVFFVLILILSAMVKIGFEKFKEWNFARNTLVVQEEKIKEEEGRKGNLKEVLDYLRDERYLVRIVKEKLNLVSPGEKVIVVVPEEEDFSQTKSNETETESFFGRVLQKFREIFKRE